MSEAVRLPADVLQRFAYEIFVAAGLPEDWALSEAEVLVWADMRGLSSHGVLRIPPYLTWMEGGLRNPNADIHIIAEKGAMVLLEADRAPGLHTMRMAMDTAIERARVHGIGWVNVRQTTHTGPMGFYVRQAAKAGMIGIATCSSRPLMAYHGTRDMALGTAPLAIAAPRANSEPLVLDMASAAVSIGAIWAARQTGTALPEGTAVEENGHLTTAPNRAVTPLPIAGPKGAGLGLMIECLASLMSGYPLLASAYEDHSRRTDYVVNAVAAALDPGAFPFADDFQAEVDRLARELAAEPLADGFDEILMPGERGDRVMKRTAREGITLTAALWEELLVAAERLSVPVPAITARVS